VKNASGREGHLAKKREGNRRGGKSRKTNEQSAQPSIFWVVFRCRSADLPIHQPNDRQPQKSQYTLPPSGLKKLKLKDGGPSARHFDPSKKGMHRGGCLWLFRGSCPGAKLPLKGPSLVAGRSPNQSARNPRRRGEVSVSGKNPLSPGPPSIELSRAGSGAIVKKKTDIWGPWEEARKGLRRKGTRYRGNGRIPSQKKTQCSRTV